MALTTDEQRLFRDDPVWRARVGQIARKVAADVSAESAAAEHHELRADLALKVLTDFSDSWERAITYNVVAQPGIVAAATDADLEFTISALWNAMSGAPGPA
jgi:hypothetical protein